MGHSHPDGQMWPNIGQAWWISHAQRRKQTLWKTRRGPIKSYRYGLAGQRKTRRGPWARGLYVQRPDIGMYMYRYIYLELDVTLKKERKTQRVRWGFHGCTSRYFVDCGCTIGMLQNCNFNVLPSLVKRDVGRKTRLDLSFARYPFCHRHRWAMTLAWST